MRSTKRQTDLESRRIEAADLLSRCNAAARMSLRGANWSPDDRADCAADLVTRVWADATEAHAVSSRHGKTTVPESMATFTRLYGMASNWRRGAERLRERDMTQALLSAERAEGFTPWVEAPASETGGTPWGARRSALEMLRALGLLGESESPQWGPLWTLAYSAARAVQADGSLAREEIAAELEITHATLRQHLTRAPGRIPSVGLASKETRRNVVHGHAEALSIPTGGLALKPSRSRTLSADMGTRQNGPREHLPRKDHAPVTVKRSAALKRSRSAWKLTGKQGQRNRADWTADLPERTSKRLAAAAQLRQDRDDARTDSERESMRLAALAR